MVFGKEISFYLNPISSTTYIAKWENYLEIKGQNMNKISEWVYSNSKNTTTYTIKH